MCGGEGVVSVVICVNTRAHTGAFRRSGFRRARLCMRMYSRVYTCDMCVERQVSEWTDLCPWAVKVCCCVCFHVRECGAPQVRSCPGEDPVCPPAS